MCGGVRFEVTEPLVSASYCHCTRCQRRTGTAAAVSARVAPGSLRILSGEELLRAYEPADGFADLPVIVVTALDRSGRLASYSHGIGDAR